MDDYLKVIRLGLGKGAPGQQACWMTALQAHMNGEWTDQCKCVDPVINMLCIRINDLYDGYNDARTEDIMNFGLFRVLGTNGTFEDTERRMYHIVDTAIRKWLPTTLWGFGRPVSAQLIGALPQIVDAETALHARKHMRDHDATAMPGGILACVADALAAARIAAEAVTTTVCANNLRSTPTGVASSAIEVVLVRGPLSLLRIRETTRTDLFPVLAELIEMGPHETKEMPEPVGGIARFHQACGVR